MHRTTHWLHPELILHYQEWVIRATLGKKTFDSKNIFSARLGWRVHTLRQTRPVHKLACIKSGSGSYSYQGNRNLLSAIHWSKTLKEQKSIHHSKSCHCRFTSLLSSWWSHQVLTALFHLQVVQKVCLFIGNVAVAFACFCSLYSQRPKALCCKLKLFLAFSPGCSAPFSSL